MRSSTRLWSITTVFFTLQGGVTGCANPRQYAPVEVDATATGSTSADGAITIPSTRDAKSDVESMDAGDAQPPAEGEAPDASQTDASFADGATSGMQGDAESADATVDHCSPNPCVNEGECRNVSGGFMCSCQAPWAGQTCAQGMFTPLGVLSNGSYSYATGVDSVASVIVGYGDSSTGEQALVWLAEGDSFSEPIPLGEAGSRANGVSGDGKFAVGYGFSGVGAQHAMRWRIADGAMEDLVPSSVSSVAYATNADGSVVVGVADGVAFRWTTNSIKYLGDGESLAVSADGSVVTGGGTSSAFIWSAVNEMTTPIGGLEMASSARATAVSRDGTVAVGFSNADGTILAFRAEAGSRAATLGAKSLQAYATDQTGALVAGDAPAWVWTESAGVLDLTTILRTAGIDTSAWYLTRVSAMTPSSAVLVGDGTRTIDIPLAGLSRTEAWVVRLRPEQDL
jgi:uncharacterized membrane protein